MLDIDLEGIYCGAAPGPADLIWRWNPDPVLLAALVALTLMVRRSRAGVAGAMVLWLAFVSPLCALSSALFSARVVHHVLLVAVAAPLLAAALPVRRPGPTALLLTLASATLWFWHVPMMYDAALSHKATYWIMQLSLLGTSVAFWHAVLHERTAPLSGALAVLGAFMLMGLLGALLTFAPAPLYAVHSVAPYDWGLTPLADQQLGGLVMWVPAGLPYAILIAQCARRAWHRAVAA